MLGKVFLCILLLSQLTFGKTRYKESQFTQNVDSENFQFIKLKHVKQIHNYCVTASAEMILNYFNYQADQKSLAFMISKNSIEGRGTNYRQTIETINGFGFAWEEGDHFNGDFDKGLKALQDEIKQKNPPMVALKFSSSLSHAVVFVGYDQENVFLIDPNKNNTAPYKGAYIVSFKDFKKIWTGYFIKSGPSTKAYEVAQLDEQLLKDHSHHLFEKIKKGMKANRQWALVDKILAEIDQDRVKISFNENILSKSNQDRSSDLKNYFKNFFYDYVTFQQGNGIIPLFFNDDYLVSVYSFDSRRKKYSILAMDKKSLQIEETVIPEHYLKKYLTRRVKGGRYEIGVMLCQIVK